MGITRINRKCHCESLKHLYFFARQTEKKRVFCGTLWLAMKSRSILIISNAKSHEWILANHQHLPKRNIIVTEQCSAFGGICKASFTMSYSNRTITGDRYQLQLNRLNEALFEKRPVVASDLRKVMLLHDNAWPYALQKLSRKHWCSSSGKFSRTQCIPQT